MFSKADKDANQLIAMERLTSKSKWTPMQAAAIVGNLTAESYMNPATPRGDDNTAMGIAQWRGDRVKKFLEVMGRHCEDSSLEDQIDFVTWELRNTEKKAGDLLKKAKTIEEAVHVVDKYYERSSGQALDRRVKFAKASLDAWSEKKGICTVGQDPLRK